jgi:uncharacterized membrane-anchored protein YitT (DUF2179 family)
VTTSKPQPGFASALGEFALITAGAALLVVSVDVFLVPGRIAPGGVSGLSIILNDRLGWPIGLTMLILNIPLLALGFRRLGRFRFLVRTAYVVLIYSLGVDALTRFVPVGGLSDNTLLNALYGGVVGGIGTGLVYRGGGTVGGTGILGRVLQLRSGMPISQVYLLTDGGVILLAGVVFGWELGLYALLTLFVWGLATDYLLEGPSVVRTAFIVTDYAHAVAQAIVDQVGVGVTTWPAEGQYTQERHTVLFCTISRPDVDLLRRAVAAADADAFLVIGHGHQATGGVVRRGRAGSV